MTCISLIIFFEYSPLSYDICNLIPALEALLYKLGSYNVVKPSWIVRFIPFLIFPPLHSGELLYDSLSIQSFYSFHFIFFFSHFLFRIFSVSLFLFPLASFLSLFIFHVLFRRNDLHSIIHLLHFIKSNSTTLSFHSSHRQQYLKLSANS